MFGAPATGVSGVDVDIPHTTWRGRYRFLWQDLGARVRAELEARPPRRGPEGSFLAGRSRSTQAHKYWGDDINDPEREIIGAKPGNPHAFSLALANHNHIAYRGCNCV